jgi:two-component system OmpR family response regulator
MKLLVVEDNKRLGRFLKRALEEERHVVDLVSDGATALKQTQIVAYDLVVLDWMLPDVDGLTVCRELRSRGDRLPIVMLTARTEVSERIAALDAGVDDYIVKPFDLGEFLARVRATIRRLPGEDAVHVGPLAIDRLDHRVTVAGRTLPLTQREFGLLAYLARAAGRTVTRTELLEKLWDMSFDPESNVVEAQIKNLRDKLGTHGQMIETVRGSGYRLKAQ